MSGDPALDGRIRIERAGARWDVILDRPKRRNAFGGRMREDLAAAFLDAAKCWPEVRVVVLRGEGGPFCAGGDVEALDRMREAGDSEALRQLLQLGANAIRAVRAFPGPVVAFADGPAMGAGLALFSACPVRVATERATFGMAFVRIGLHPDWGGAALVAEAVGASRAQEWALSGRVVGAAEAERAALVHHCVAAQDAEAALSSIVEPLIAGAPLAQKEIRRTFRGADTTLEAAFAREQEAQAALFGSADLREGLRSFLEKRKAGFVGG